MSIKVITIDFWNTLFDSSFGTERNAFRQQALLSEIEKLNKNISDEEFAVALKASWKYFDTIWKSEMRTPMPIDTVEFFWNYLKLPYDDLAIDNIVNAFGDSVIRIPPNVIDGVNDALEILSKKYQLAIISDTGFSPGTTLRVLLNQNGLLHYFNAFSFSDETGVAKPHPKAYHHIFNELNVVPEECIHIGDIEQTDIVGAKGLGMKAIRFSGDPTASLNKANPQISLADKDCYSWREIVEFIDGID